MKKLKSTLTLLLAVFFAGSVSAAQQGNMVAGKHYEVMSPDAKVEPVVEEFFNYACAACYNMEKFVIDFKAKNPGIKFQPVPVELRPAWKIYVKAYYIGEKLGVLAQSHNKIFHRIHVEKKYFANEDDMKAFFLSLGVDEKAYDGVAKSYWLNTKMRLAKQYAMKNKIMSTPILLVNKRFKLNNSELGSYERLGQAMVELSGVNNSTQAAK